MLYSTLIKSKTDAGALACALIAGEVGTSGAVVLEDAPDYTDKLFLNYLNDEGNKVYCTVYHHLYGMVEGGDWTDDYCLTFADLINLLYEHRRGINLEIKHTGTCVV